MKIFVKVKAKAKRNRVEKLSEAHYRVYVTESPRENRANMAVIEAL